MVTSSARRENSVDGEVVAGEPVDESMLTGEPVPVIKQPGDLVTAGTLNQSGAIALLATRLEKIRL